MTDDHSPPPVDDSQLHGLVDGRLPPEQAQALNSRLEPEQRETAAQWARQRARLQALHAEQLHVPLPDALRVAAATLQARQDEKAAWSRWAGVAAGWVFAFGLGWLVHGQGLPAAAQGSALAARSGAAQLFAQQAAIAHAVYQPEQRHAVEVTAAQQDHLVQWLSKRLGRPLTVPALGAEGFELVGGRLLPGAAGARALFMYQNAAGVRVTLYLGALGPSADAQETAFHFHTEGPVANFYWLDQGFGYALSGELPRTQLLALATAVHQQL